MDGFSADTSMVQSIPLTEDLMKQLGLQISGSNVNYLVTDYNSSQYTDATNVQMTEDLDDLDHDQESQTILYQIVYPEEFNLTPAKVKRGRPKRKKTEETTSEIAKPLTQKAATRTRSGRIVKLPLHMKQDYKKIDMTDEPVIKFTEFDRMEEQVDTVPKLEKLVNHQRKRTFSTQYKCPKCKKIYLGKIKMIKHLNKYPDHGPFPEQKKDLNFDVWNYLVDITQKCRPGERGYKFCEEITNLLHNLKLLTSALFKTVVDNKNFVQVDKVLGYAIGLTPGKYLFDENELYTDVTVLKLFTNTDFFKPNSNDYIPDIVPKTDPTVNEKIGTNTSDAIFKDINELGDDTELKESFNVVSTDDGELNTNKVSDKNVTGNSEIFSESPINDFSKIDLNGSVEPFKNTIDEMRSSIEKNSSLNSNNSLIPCIKDEDQNNIDFNKKIVDRQDNPLTLHSDLLPDNLLLNTIPHLPNTVDELILSAAESTTNLLDNSTSSDEVMNVDQFVNERFKKITEPDTELSNTSLNLDLPTMDLFHFHTS